MIIFGGKMKKCVALALILCMVFCALQVEVFAEEFTIRNGIKFGMSKEEVIAIEGRDPYNVRLDIFENGVIWYDEILFDEEIDFCYRFDFGELNKLHYVLASHSGLSVKQRNPQYEKIDLTISDKYGKCAYEGYEEMLGGDTAVQVTKWYVPNGEKCVEIRHDIGWIAVNEAYMTHNIIYTLMDISYEEAMQQYKINDDKI